MRTFADTSAGFVWLVVFGIVTPYLVAFALKVAWIHWKTWRQQPGGFEVKMTTGPTPVLEKKEENDHG